ncbi:hypothetical protein N0V91_006631 [Didymella pomorum]|jgi:hypothetical protein|uniref:Chitin-binding type-4 domain-containing protein n=1 Tax=Didymella pomorum TaxID=749634 RepID=A0A9W9D619_9PLEO|nr:hypothetical protein N0V91_006631 [Didymella pomorum]
MKSYSAAIALAGFASSVAAHGFISSPAPRMPGDGLKAACGDQVYNQQSSDHYGNVQGALQNLQGSHPDCRMWQCKGVPFSDATDIFEYTAGQVIPMKVEIRAPHDGVANVSIVNIKTDKVIGEPLKSWDSYALTSSPISAHPEWTSFDITMPDVSAECANKGDCVIQWYWDAASIDQTYESCIDFTMGGGSGSGSGNSTTPTTPESSAPAATSAAATSAAATSAAATSAAASAPAATSAVAEATPTPSSAAPATPSATGAAGSSTLPEQFTIEQFVSWLEANAGSSAVQKLRRAIAARTARTHARAFRV